MEKIDFKKKFKELYSASAKKCALINVPEMNYLMLDGCGNPNTSEEFQDAVEALFSVAYTVKFMIKKNLAIDYGVMPLEGLWWGGRAELVESEKDEWNWTLMIMQPEYVTTEMITASIDKVMTEKKVSAAGKLRFAAFAEGEAAQLLHVGPFSEEGPTVAKLQSFIAENGYDLRGRHHEIYLSDARRAAPAKWKTIIRQGIIMTESRVER